MTQNKIEDPVDENYGDASYVKIKDIDMVQEMNATHLIVNSTELTKSTLIK